MYQFFVFLIFVFSVISCKKPVNLKGIDINNQKLVINSINQIDKSDNWTLIEMDLSKSLTVFDSNYLDEQEPIDDATIKIVSNSNQELLINQSSQNQIIIINSSEFDHGESYTLEVSHPSFETIIANTTIPQPAKINSFNLAGNVSSLDTPFYVDLSFKDVMNEDNYYFIDLYLTIYHVIYDSATNSYDTTGSSGNLLRNYTTNNNLIDKDYEPKLLLTDDFFKNNDFNISIQISLDSNQVNNINDINKRAALSAKVISLSRDEYLYRKTLYIYELNQFNPLSEPTQVYSNVENGMGIFAFNSPVSYTIPLD